LQVLAKKSLHFTNGGKYGLSFERPKINEQNLYTNMNALS